jgi:hypothetical protein
MNAGKQMARKWPGSLREARRSVYLPLLCHAVQPWTPPTDHA